MFFIKLKTSSPMVSLMFFFSRIRRHTIWTGDWSSDVCSSDLSERAGCGAAVNGEREPVGLRAGELEKEVGCERLHIHGIGEEGAAGFVRTAVGQTQP